MGILSAKNKFTSVVGLDLGQSVIKMAEYSKSEKQILAIAKLFVEPTDWSDTEQFKSRLQEWLLNNIQGKRPELSACLTISQATIRPISVPPDEKQLDEAVLWDMSKFTAANLDEHHLVYTRQNSGNMPDQKVLLSALCSKDTIKKTTELLSFLSLPLTTLDIDTFATINALNANYPNQSAKPAIILKADLGFVQCISTQSGQYIDHDLINIPSDFADLSGETRSQALIQVGQDIKQSLQSITPHSENSKLFICGDLSSDVDLHQLIQQQQGEPPVLLDAFRKIKFPCAPEDLDKAKETAPQCATAVGLALRQMGDC